MADTLRVGVQQFPDKLAITDGVVELSFRDLDAVSRNIAQRLVTMGVQVEDRVVVIARKDVALVAAILGSVRAGAICRTR